MTRRIPFAAGPRWTAAHERFVIALHALHSAQARRGWAGPPPSMPHWIQGRWKVSRIIDLTPAQCRHGCRQMNAWRAAVENRWHGAENSGASHMRENQRAA